MQQYCIDFTNMIVAEGIYFPLDKGKRTCDQENMCLGFTRQIIQNIWLQQDGEISQEPALDGDAILAGDATVCARDINCFYDRFERLPCSASTRPRNGRSWLDRGRVCQSLSPTIMLRRYRQVQAFSVSIVQSGILHAVGGYGRCCMASY